MQAAAPPADRVRNILVYRIGSLGDTLMILPALWTLKAAHPGARFVLLSNRPAGKSAVQAKALFDGSRLFDDYISYPVGRDWRSRLSEPLRFLGLWRRLRARRFDAVAYFAPSERRPGQVRRDRVFFALAGIGRFWAGSGFLPRAVRPSSGPMPRRVHEADQILGRLANDGFEVPPPAQRSFDLRTGETEAAKLRAWLAGLERDGGRRWIGVGPGSLQPAKVWPEDRFLRVVSAAIRDWDLWPVVFGGRDEQALGERLVGAWGRGYNACGALGVREASEALSRCVAFLGNDTGTLHLAAARRVPCLGVYSAHAAPGQWEPWGSGHRVLRRAIDCEGCGLKVCVERRMECMLTIRETEVADALGTLLSGIGLAPCPA